MIPNWFSWLVPFLSFLANCEMVSNKYLVLYLKKANLGRWLTVLHLIVVLKEIAWCFWSQLKVGSGLWAHYPPLPMQISKVCCILLSWPCFFKRIYLLIFRERGRGETSMCGCRSRGPTGIRPATQACALTGNWTGNTLVCSPCSVH